MKNTVRVKAAPGRRVPIHTAVARSPGGMQLYVEGDGEHELPDVGYVRRRIAAGDLVVVPAESGRTSTLGSVLTGDGPPAVFGDLPPFDPTNPGPHTATPRPAPKKKES